jgi:hypothetical protein
VHNAHFYAVIILLVESFPGPKEQADWIIQAYLRVTSACGWGREGGGGIFLMG